MTAHHALCRPCARLILVSDLLRDQWWTPRKLSTLLHASVATVQRDLDRLVAAGDVEVRPSAHHMQGRVYRAATIKTAEAA